MRAMCRKADLTRAPATIPWLVSAFPYSFGHATATAGEATWCQLWTQAITPDTSQMRMSLTSSAGKKSGLPYLSFHRIYQL